jgi:DNA excision repair protein ERCC-2
LKVIKLSVQDFAHPCPRTGHIDHGQVGATAEQGTQLHQQIQRKRSQSHENYHAEVKITWAFERAGFRFEVEGRVDGLFAGATPVIEEIKSSFDPFALRERLLTQKLSHPYVLQLLTYAYIHLQTHQVLPALSFHLVSARNKKSTDLPWPWQGESYQHWLDLRLNELVEEAQRAEARASRRKKIAARLAFPFPTPRKGQKELVATIQEKLVAGNSLLLQAPTGLGKTVGVLFPVLQSALKRGQSVFYATPKNSQHTVAEEALEGFRAQGASLKNLTLTAKRKLCLKDEVFCRPEYCEFARDYHDKVREAGLKTLLRAKRKLSAKTFRKLGEEHVVCPYELQWEVADEADVLIGDYNHVFAPRSALSRVSPMLCGSVGKPALVIDEAHNLPARAMEYYSPQLTKTSLERRQTGVALLPRRFATEGTELIHSCMALLASYQEGKDGSSHVVSLDPEKFQDLDQRLRNFLTRYLESDAEIGPDDPIMGLCSEWSHFTEILTDVVLEERSEFFATCQGQQGGSLRLTCCDASRMLRPQYKNFEHTVAFSATLKPFDFYARLTGLEGDKLHTEEFASPFAPNQRKVLIIPQISTKWSKREQNYDRIAETISRVTACRPGNYLAFFPSFAFLQEVQRRILPPAGFRLWKQDRGASSAQVQAMLEGLKTDDCPTILLAVQGGVFSEGIDYPGEMAVGAFVIGPPLPNFDVEREGMKDYYQQHYEQGFNYAYAFPAMAKAVQSAGRVIRNETDKGIVILIDDRFLERSYAASMPSDWFASGPQELVSQSILADIQHFWSCDN